MPPRSGALRQRHLFHWRQLAGLLLRHQRWNSAAVRACEGISEEIVVRLRVLEFQGGWHSGVVQACEGVREEGVVRCRARSLQGVPALPPDVLVNVVWVLRDLLGILPSIPNDSRQPGGRRRRRREHRFGHCTDALLTCAAVEVIAKQDGVVTRKRGVRGDPACALLRDLLAGKGGVRGDPACAQLRVAARAAKEEEFIAPCAAAMAAGTAADDTTAPASGTAVAGKDATACMHQRGQCGSCGRHWIPSRLGTGAGRIWEVVHSVRVDRVPDVLGTDLSCIRHLKCWK
mmetsp:Transcript_70855/g.179356  ORF Transcript_70855/g.179356 Transcript_70855/m.179356 type:complete len:288 (+) Transcript_70855:564-1427(+)